MSQNWVNKELELASKEYDGLPPNVKAILEIDYKK